MWQYEKKLQYPVKIANPNPALAKVIISQLGGADFKKLYIKNGAVKKVPKKKGCDLAKKQDSSLFLWYN